MKNKWIVRVNGKIVKEYPLKVQAIIYCYLKGYVMSGYDEWDGYKYIEMLDDRVKIDEEVK